MPEEHNRISTDHLSDLPLAPADVADQHLATGGSAVRTMQAHLGDVAVPRAPQATKDRPTERDGPPDRVIQFLIERD